jgi:HEPN domain-containing protein
MNEKVLYWIELSDYDLDTANAMLISKRYLYVGFMCHQVIEKIFKSLYVKLKNETPPFIHSLSNIAKKGDFYDSLNTEFINFIDVLEPLNIESRYPIHKDRILKGLDEDKCIDLINNTLELQTWIKTKL